MLNTWTINMSGLCSEGLQSSFSSIHNTLTPHFELFGAICFTLKWSTVCLWSCFAGHYSVHSMINFQWERNIAVLMLAQRLRCWPNIEPTLAECTLAVLSIHIRGVNCFAVPAVKSVSLQTSSPAKSQSLGNFVPTKVGDFAGLRFWWLFHPPPPHLNDSWHRLSVVPTYKLWSYLAFCLWACFSLKSAASAFCLFL